jgi:hypothetical protein
MGVVIIRTFSTTNGKHKEDLETKLMTRITNIRRIMKTKRIPLCPTHFSQMEQRELHWSDLYLTQKFV